MMVNDEKENEEKNTTSPNIVDRSEGAKIDIMDFEVANKKSSKRKTPAPARRKNIPKFIEDIWSEARKEAEKRREEE